MARPALSASRATAVLDLLTAFPERVFTMSEIVKATGIGFASCYNIINALVQRGFLVRRPDEKSYLLGPMLVVAGQAAMRSHPRAAAAVEAAEMLFSEINIPVHVITVVGDEILVLATATGPAAAPTSTGPGQRMPLVAPVGATFMAAAPPAAVDAWVARANAGEGEHVDEWRKGITLIQERGIEIALRDPNVSGFGALLVGMASGRKPLDYRQQATQLISAQVSRLILPAQILANEKYEVSSIVAPIEVKDGAVEFCLALRGFPTKLSGEQINHLTKHMLRACEAVSGGRSLTGSGK